jgi:subtilisin family serine protease
VWNTANVRPWCTGSNLTHMFLDASFSYPAQYEECLSIAAVSNHNGLPVAHFSNSNVSVDYAGIGVDVISLKPGGGYQSMSGTSMACPHVCGFIAALLSGGTAAADVRTRLDKEFTIDIGVPGPDPSTGLVRSKYLSCRMDGVSTCPDIHRGLLRI